MRSLVFVYLWVGIIFESKGLEISVFNVGFGNFVLLREENNVLVIDCGKATCFSSNESKGILRSALEGCECCTVVITHAHFDHFSAANVLWNCFPK
ncbi:MAG: MBL fold metallo-hydrolase [Puniceicoccales bacterium]|nr:MBL fold metallo-hydrolase [Puniceicoccales bacterium]